MLKQGPRLEAWNQCQLSINRQLVDTLDRERSKLGGLFDNSSISLTERLAHIRWVEEQFGSSSAEHLQELRQCAFHLRNADEYRDDEVYVGVWLKYATLVSNPEDVFAYMQGHGIGSRSSMY